MPGWRAKRALTGEVDGKLSIAALAHMVYITRRVHGRFTDSTYIKKGGNGRRGKLAIDTLDSSMMKKTAADSKTKGSKPESTRDLLG